MSESSETSSKSFKDLLRFISNNFQLTQYSESRITKPSIHHTLTPGVYRDYYLWCKDHGVIENYEKCIVSPGELQMMLAIGDHIDREHHELHGYTFGPGVLEPAPVHQVRGDG